MARNNMLAFVRKHGRRSRRMRWGGVGRLLLASMLAGVGPFIVPSNALAGQHPDPQPAAAAPTTPLLGRWLELEAATLAIRYRGVRDGQDDVLFNQVQTQEVARGHVRVDAGGRIRAGFTVQSGHGFPGSWNSTGIGTGDPTWSVYVKHLFADVRPVTGIAVQYGSIGFARGQNTEATTYDNDGYLEGARVTIARPDVLHVDELSVTVAYLGDLSTSSAFSRLRHLDRQNFRQVLVARQFGRRVRASTDYVDDALEGGVFRQGARIELGRSWLDAVRAEYAVRVTDAPHQSAVVVTGEKTIGTVLVYGGGSRVGSRLGALNGDRYATGAHAFTGGSWRLPSDFSLGWFVHHELDAPATSRAKLRVDIVCTWDALKALRRSHVVP